MTHLLFVVQSARSSSFIYPQRGEKEEAHEEGGSIGAETFEEPQDQEESLGGERGGGVYALCRHWQLKKGYLSTGFGN